MVVSQVRSRRAHIVKPMDGWASLQTESGYVILEAIMRPTKYKVRGGRWEMRHDGRRFGGGCFAEIWDMEG